MLVKEPEDSFSAVARLLTLRLYLPSDAVSETVAARMSAAFTVALLEVTFALNTEKSSGVLRSAAAVLRLRSLLLKACHSVSLLESVLFLSDTRSTRL